MLLENVLVFDGGMGSELAERGMKIGQNPEELNITNDRLIKDIHQGYVDANADVITTNTFGANRFKLKNSRYTLKEIIDQAIINALSAKPKYVFFDMGPLGQLIEPLGTLSFDEAYLAFKEIVLLAKDKVDGFILETFTDLYELKAAILAVKENSIKPVFASMSFDSTGRTLTGTTPEIMTLVLEGLDVDALGVNCSLGPIELESIVKRILKVSHKPVIVQPNRGLPKIINKETVYDLDSETFFNKMQDFVDEGVSIIGGCCGTNSEFISKISVLKKAIKKRCIEDFSAVSTASNMVDINGVKIIGERLNPTGKKTLKEAIINENYDYIIKEAIKQEQAGADILDVNMGVPKVDEVKIMKNVLLKLMEYTNVPLQIDSSNIEAIETACRYYNGIPLINSVNGNYEVMDKIFPIAKKYGAMVIGLAMDENGVPRTAKERFNIAKRIVDYALKYGIKKEKLVIDTLVLTASAEQELVIETIKALRMVSFDLKVKTALGVSNVSFGLPNRGLLNKTFLVMGLANGLNLPIINPLDDELINAISAFNVLSGDDKNSNNYIEKNTEVVKEEVNYDLAYVIKKGLKDDVERITIEALKTMKPMDIINKELIPILNTVGKNYEDGKIFLPQLLASSEATKKAFEIISTKFAMGNEKKGPIMMLTVRGDVHDIGKNIVKVILESYGYYVIDLGKDVLASEVVKAYHTYKPKAIGLSALMTTTVVSMEETIKELKKIEGMCPIFVGGAVLTEEIAKDINADYYSRDALEFVTILEGLF